MIIGKFACVAKSMLFGRKILISLPGDVSCEIILSVNSRRINHIRSALGGCTLLITPQLLCERDVRVTWDAYILVQRCQREGERRTQLQLSHTHQHTALPRWSVCACAALLKPPFNIKTSHPLATLCDTALHHEALISLKWQKFD